MLLRLAFCALLLTGGLCRADEFTHIPPAPDYDDAIEPTPGDVPASPQFVPRDEPAPPAPRTAPTHSFPAPHSRPCPCNGPAGPIKGLQTYSGIQPAPLQPATIWVDPPVMVGPATAGGLHVRYPYYSYRAPWYTPGPASLNVTIVW